MFSKLIRMLLLLAMLWQGFLLPLATGATKQAAELEHVVVHTKSMSHHHHHADEQTHFVSSADDVHHQHLKDCTQQLAIIHIPVNHVASLPDFKHYSDLKSELRSVFIECPLRPPKQTA